MYIWIFFPTDTVHKVHVQSLASTHIFVDTRYFRQYSRICNKNLKFVSSKPVAQSNPLNQSSCIDIPIRLLIDFTTRLSMPSMERIRKGLNVCTLHGEKSFCIHPFNLEISCRHYTITHIKYIHKYHTIPYHICLNYTGLQRWCRIFILPQFGTMRWYSEFWHCVQLGYMLRRVVMYKYMQ